MTYLPEKCTCGTAMKIHGSGRRHFVCTKCRKIWDHLGMTEKFEMSEFPVLDNSWGIGTQLVIDEVSWEIVGRNYWLCENENSLCWTLVDSKGNGRYLLDSWGNRSWLIETETELSPSSFASIEVDSEIGYDGMFLVVWQIDRLEELVVEGETALPIVPAEKPFLIFLGVNDEPSALAWIRDSKSLLYFKHEKIRTLIIEDQLIKGRVGF